LRRPGYTAPEALAALAIVGLAISGLATSLSLIGAHQNRIQSQLAEGVRDRNVDQRLRAFLLQGGPYRSDQPGKMTGDPEQIRIGCGQGECSARLRADLLITVDAGGRERVTHLPAGGDPAFWYVANSQMSDVWPPPVPEGGSWQPLQAVLIKARGQAGRPLAVARVWSDQRFDCEYDPVIEDCRGGGA
jgi:type II secretory pathway pseudopilin PulG